MTEQIQPCGEHSGMVSTVAGLAQSVDTMVTENRETRGQLADVATQAATGRELRAAFVALGLVIIGTGGGLLLHSCSVSERAGGVVSDVTHLRELQVEDRAAIRDVRREQLAQERARLAQDRKTGEALIRIETQLKAMSERQDRHNGAKTPRRRR